MIPHSPRFCTYNLAFNGDGTINRELDTEQMIDILNLFYDSQAESIKKFKESSTAKQVMNYCPGAFEKHDLTFGVETKKKQSKFDTKKSGPVKLSRKRNVGYKNMDKDDVSQESMGLSDNESQQSDQRDDVLSRNSHHKNNLTLKSDNQFSVPQKISPKFQKGMTSI